MICLFLALAAFGAEPPVRAVREPVQQVLSPGGQVMALRALPTDELVLVVRDGERLVRLRGRERFAPAGRVETPAEAVAVADDGALLLLHDGAVSRWDGVAIQLVPAPEGLPAIGLRQEGTASRAAGAPVTWKPAPGVAVDLVPPERGLAPKWMSSPRLAAGAEGWTLGGISLVGAAAPALVDASQLTEGWAALVGGTLQIAGTVGVVDGWAPGDTVPVGVRLLVDGGDLVVVAWDTERLRATTIAGVDQPPIAWERRWLPLGQHLEYPRPATPADPLVALSRVEAGLRGVEPTHVALLERWLVVAGSGQTADGPAPMVLLVARVPRP